jgi:hypothetical protein
MATDPGCAVDGDVGKMWLDTTDAFNTALKICEKIRGALQWVEK